MESKLNFPLVASRPGAPAPNLLRRLWRALKPSAATTSQLGSGVGLDTEKRLSLMLESVPVNLWSTDAELNITFSQGAGLHLIGLESNEQVGMTLYEILQTRDPSFTPLAAHLRALQGELVRYETDWRGRFFETRVEPLRGPDGRISGTVGIAIDITERKSLYDELHTRNVYFATLFESAPQAIAILDDKDLITRVNGEFTRLFGYASEEAVGKSINDLIVPPELLEEGANLTSKVAAGGKVRVESIRNRKDGGTVWVSISATPISVRQESDRVFAMYHDISAIKRAEEEMKKLLLVDELTGLPNRRAFITLSEQALKLAMRMGRDVLLIFIDVDHLKHVNDTWGHLEGDRALIDTARVLHETCREADIVARLGGDEFVALLTIDSDQTADLICSRIKTRVDEHNLKSQRPFTLSLSVGATRARAEGAQLVELLAQADAALYEQKRSRGRARTHALSR
ncbi:MAG TPA: diguanylate cyclase [Gemmatimonadaceae bacterium]|nr:diguanylate cyclase [Gemmatimonadaceae bacterium]